MYQVLLVLFVCDVMLSYNGNHIRYRQPPWKCWTRGASEHDPWLFTSHANLVSGHQLFPHIQRWYTNMEH